MSYLSHLATRFVQHLWLGVFVFLLFLTSNVRYYLIEIASKLSVMIAAFVEALCWGLLVSLLVALIPNGYRVVRRYLIGLILLLASFLFFGEQILISGYSSLFTDSIALNILATNPAEAAEFMSGAIHLSDFFLPLVLFIVSLLLSYLVYRLCRGGMGKIRLYWVAIPIVALLGGGAISFYFIVAKYRINNPSYRSMAPASRFVVGTMICLEEMSSLKEQMEALRAIDCGVVRQDSSFAQHSLVLVVGESATRAYHHCYGFPLANTPFLDSMLAQNEVILFDNAVAPAPHTTTSLSEVLTFHDRTDTHSPWNSKPTLPLILQKAGYYTYWLSNQEKQGLFIQPVAAIASTSDSLYYVNVRSSRDWWTIGLKLDEDVLPHLLTNQTTPAPKDKLFELVHLMGSHPICKERYPSTFARFTPKDLLSPFPENAKNEAICEYANSILYTDYILHEIIQRYAQETAVVLYVADHGILTYDPEAGEKSNIFGHSLHWKSLSVPFIVYVSPKMRQRHPELVPRLQAAKHNLFTTDVLPQFLCSLMGIQVEKYPLSPSNPLAPKYIPCDSVEIHYDGEKVVVHKQ